MESSHISHYCYTLHENKADSHTIPSFPWSRNQLRTAYQGRRTLTSVTQKNWAI
jgi:hypothetical protein